MTAFLWALNELVTGGWPVQQTSVLYVSPLRALNNDIQRNLIDPLGELRRFFRHRDTPFPDIRVLTRSGDTPQGDRRRMLNHPPEILITTPESLNLLLSSPRGRRIFINLRTVILDEIHAVVSDKRGVYLLTAIDRLVLLSGEFQRIALSATVRPLDTVAAYFGGFIRNPTDGSSKPTPRSIAIVRSREKKRYDVSIQYPEAPKGNDSGGGIWDALSARFRELIQRNRSTLLFTNSRALCEKLVLKINRGENRVVAYAHHGSLSREIRNEVEAQLKAGNLKAIVATNSLELGIDIGALDEVILIQSPPSIAAAVQRIGRAGHNVGDVSRGQLFPSHRRDILNAAVLAQGIMEQDIEEVRPIDGALDVLAQVLVSMTAVESWDIDDLFSWVGTCYPYRNLSRSHFDLVLQMLAGRYSGTRIRELKPRVSLDYRDNTVRARRGALQALYLSGGVIPDRGYFHLRHADSNALIGDLDEEFVWEGVRRAALYHGNPELEDSADYTQRCFRRNGKPG